MSSKPMQAMYDLEGSLKGKTVINCIKCGKPYCKWGMGWKMKPEGNIEGPYCGNCYREEENK